MTETKMVMITYCQGTVDIRQRPPVVTIEGYPARPGEGWVDYCTRMRRELLARGAF